MRQIREFLIAEDGPTAVEYCVMLGMILLVVIGTIATFGNSQSGRWSSINNDLKSHGI